MKNRVFIFFSGISAFVLIFLFSEEFSSGFHAGLLNCAKIVIPSLFPFLVASSLTGTGELPPLLKRIFSPITKHFFHLPSDCMPAIILGQLGGYLSGASAANSLFSSGVISLSQARRLVLFCVNSGVGFSVNAVGNALLGSREAGKILLVSLCVSSVATGFFIRFIPDDTQKERIIRKNNTNFSSALVGSVYSASSAMLNCCGFVCLFSGISSVTGHLIKNQTANLVIACLLEVTSGCAAAAGKVSMPVIAAVCAFGGLCVHMQIFSLTKDFGVNMPVFYLFRAIHSAFAYISCKTILYFHPIEEQVFVSVSHNMQLWSFSAPAAVSLMFLCTLLILDLDNNKKIC